MSHRARRRFGQNFLHDANIIDRMLTAIAPRTGDRVVEIGPGQAALTGPLLRTLGELDVIEIDRDLAAALPQRLAGDGVLRVHTEDALTVDYRRLAGSGDPLRLVGNLPYNISTPLLFHVLGFADVITDMHFLLQREVVDRMAAEPGGRDYGRLSVMVQYRCDVVPLFDVPPGAFRPAPKVTSRFVRLIPHGSPPIPARDESALARVVALAFGQRRKTLRNTLRGVLSAEAIAAIGIDPGARAETLDLADFVALANAAAHTPPP